MNNKGSVTFIGILVALIIFTSMLVAILKAQRTYAEVQERASNYLCFKYLNHITAKYIKRVAYLNIGIRTAFLAQAVPLLTAEAKLTHTALKQTQNVFHVSYMKNLIRNDYCSSTQAPHYVIKNPYKTKGKILLARNIDGTTILKRKKWTVYLLPKTKSFNSGFILKGDYKMQSPLSSKLELTTKEIGKKALLNWKPFSGFSS